MRFDTHYMFDGEKVTETTDEHEWIEWRISKPPTRVAYEKRGDVEVSTVFLCIDHSDVYGPSPILFETMVFGGEHHLKTERYQTVVQAREGHARMVNYVFGRPCTGEWFSGSGGQCVYNKCSNRATYANADGTVYRCGECYANMGEREDDWQKLTGSR